MLNCLDKVWLPCSIVISPPRLLRGMVVMLDHVVTGI